MGQGLRFVQEYFLVACSLADLIRRFRRGNADWRALPDKVAIQLNDTHPSARRSRADAHPARRSQVSDWDEAWDLTRRTLAYTNHTLLPEALEKWPVRWFEMLLPRQLEIIYEINRRCVDDVRSPLPGRRGPGRASQPHRGGRASARCAWPIWRSSARTAPMASPRSIPGCCATVTVKDLAEMFPERFNNKTNGVTPRRWLLLANPALAALSPTRSATAGSPISPMLATLKPLADDARLPRRRSQAKREAKSRFTGMAARRAAAIAVDPDSIFDSQVKRIHEYKRQLLNGLRIVVLYNRLRQDPNLDMPPRTFFFAGKAAPAYHLAKLIIKFLNNLAGTIDGDPAVRGRLKVVFLPEYGVSLAERLIPASDVSNQISTAGYEASGTSNMKFMMNGALDDRHARRRDDRDGRGGRRGELLPVRVDRGAGGRQPRLVQPAVALRKRTGDPRGAGPDLLRSFQPPRAGGLRAAARDAADARRPLHAPGGPDILSGSGSAAARAVRRSGGWARTPILNIASSGQVFERPHDRRIRRRNLGRAAVPGAVGNGRTSALSAFAPGYRAAGVLLHVASLPSPYGIGDLGPSALAFIDRLHEAGQRWWQVLPLGSTGYGNSPYQPLSTFAGNELLFSPEGLIEDGLLRPDACSGKSFSNIKVDYASVIPFKRQLLQMAWTAFSAGARPDLRSFDQFCHDQRHWLEDYALFRALKARYDGAYYLEWPVELVQRDPAAIALARESSPAKSIWSVLRNFCCPAKGDA